MKRIMKALWKYGIDRESIENEMMGINVSQSASAFLSLLNEPITNLLETNIVEDRLTPTGFRRAQEIKKNQIPIPKGFVYIESAKLRLNNITNLLSLSEIEKEMLKRFLDECDEDYISIPEIVSVIKAEAHVSLPELRREQLLQSEIKRLERQIGRGDVENQSVYFNDEISDPILTVSHSIGDRTTPFSSPSPERQAKLNNIVNQMKDLFPEEGSVESQQLHSSIHPAKDGIENEFLYERNLNDPEALKIEFEAILNEAIDTSPLNQSVRLKSELLDWAKSNEAPDFIKEMRKNSFKNTLTNRS